jgi:hypothetical protein
MVVRRRNKMDNVDGGGSMTDYSAVLRVAYKDAAWAIDGAKYEGIIWLDDAPMPSREQMDALWPDVQSQMAAAVDARASALAKLQALGLTEAEALALVGGTP